ncbi:hypothetical protein MY11210_003352 [Beauveria gryllotalpidicola]
MPDIAAAYSIRKLSKTPNGRCTASPIFTTTYDPSVTTKKMKLLDVVKQPAALSRDTISGFPHGAKAECERT